ncbi:hypothetical protein BDN67DRAFT_971996 [Paxillus ammoniavirescens]|nr:hypothetical protein BDN67DRAFT_971996 [Paxillus ammoniavirescens]
MPTTPGHYRGFSIMVESVSSTDLLNENQPTPVPPVNPENMQVSCSALFPRRQTRSGPTSGLPAMQLPERAVPTFNSPAPPATTSQPTTQNVLDLPAVIESPSDTRR